MEYKIKRISAFLFEIILVFLISCCFISQVQASESGDYTYNEISGGIEIAKYNGSDTDVIIPDSLDGKKVIKIGEKAFFANPTVENVVIPDSVMIIGNSAFEVCRNLKNVSVGSSVTEISDYAFRQCEKLLNINFKSNNLKRIGRSAFENNRSLLNLTIPYGTTSIGHSAFSACSNLREVIVPETVTEIITDNGFGFENTPFAYNLKNIILGKQGSAIEQHAKQYNLPFVDVENNQCANEKYYYESIEGGVKILYVKNTIMKDSIIPEQLDGKNVIEIGKSAFVNDQNLETINLPLVKKIDENAFINCTSLTRVTLPNTDIIDKNAFRSCKKLTEVIINPIKLEDEAFQDVFITKLSIGNRLESMGTYAISGAKITELQIPASIKNIEGGAFEFTALTKITIDPKAQGVSLKAFSMINRGMSSPVYSSKSLLTEVYIPAGVTDIDKEAFGDPVNLNENLIIYGTRDSAIEKFANEHKIQFKEYIEPAVTMTIEPESVSLKMEEKKALTAKFTPESEKKEVVWSSSDNNIAKVESDGVVTAIGEGNAMITASAGNLTAQCHITVQNSDFALGDVNKDKMINASDGLLTLRHSVKEIVLKDSDFTRGDVNKDSVVNASDGLQILRYSVKEINDFD